MEERKLIEKLEEFIEKHPDIIRSNWASPMRGRGGVYKFYSVIFDARGGTTTGFSFKIYENGREKGFYSLHTEGPEFNSNSVGEIIETIKEFYEEKTK